MGTNCPEEEEEDGPGNFSCEWGWDVTGGQTRRGRGNWPELRCHQTRHHIFGKKKKTDTHISFPGEKEQTTWKRRRRKRRKCTLPLSSSSSRVSRRRKRRRGGTTVHLRYYPDFEEMERGFFGRQEFLDSEADPTLFSPGIKVQHGERNRFCKKEKLFLTFIFSCDHPINTN